MAKLEKSHHLLLSKIALWLDYVVSAIFKREPLLSYSVPSFLKLTRALPLHVL